MEPMIFDIARGLIQTYFSLMEYAEASEQEQERLFKEELEKFRRNRPESLPDPE